MRNIMKDANNTVAMLTFKQSLKGNHISMERTFDSHSVLLPV